MQSSIERRRVSLFALFFLPGLSISSWVTRTPDIRDAIGASTAGMGLVLFGLSIGSLIGILSSGPLVSRWGTRPIIVMGTCALILSMPTIAIGSTIGAAFVVGLGLAIFGCGMGAGEIAMNIEGADVETVSARPFLPAMHGFFSLGTVVGALLGMISTSQDIPVVLHLMVVCLIGVIVLVCAVPAVPSSTGQRRSKFEGSSEEESSGYGSLLRDPPLVFIGVVVLGMALAEGTANDWLPLVMVDEHGLDAAFGSAIYAVFAASMTIGRFMGSPIVSRVGPMNVLLVSALMGAIGIAGISLLHHQGLAIGAVILWGLGASLGFPVALSAAGDSGAQSAARVTVASTIGYIAFLVGPPALGFVGESFGLRGALWIPLTALVLAAVLSKAAGRWRRS